MSENTKAILIGFGGTILLILFLVFRVNTSSNNKNEVYECNSCEREFTNRDDVYSIRMTGMCEPCYDDFKFTQELYDASEKYEERNR